MTIKLKTQNLKLKTKVTSHYVRSIQNMIVRALARTLLTFTLLAFSITLLVYSTYAATSHENAVENLNKGMIPEEIAQNVQPVQEPVQENLLSALLKTILNLLGFSNLSSAEVLAPRADIQHQATVPKQIEPAGDNIFLKLPGFLGQEKEMGIYQVELPKEIQKGDQTLDFECLYEKSSFPMGIHPIAGKEAEKC